MQYSRTFFFRTCVAGVIKTTSSHYKVDINIVMCCIVMEGLSSAAMSSMHNWIHPPDIGINPLKMACGRVIKHCHIHSPCALSVYNCMYWVTPRVFSWGTLQQQQNKTKRRKCSWIFGSLSWAEFYLKEVCLEEDSTALAFLEMLALRLFMLYLLLLAIYLPV